MVAQDLIPRGTRGHQGLFSNRAYAPGETLAVIEGVRRERASRYTIQTGPDEHIEPLDGLRFINHACRPNCSVQGRRLVVVAPIAPGDEITFDYAASEDCLAEPFVCDCCGKWIRGRKVRDEGAGVSASGGR